MIKGFEMKDISLLSDTLLKKVSSNRRYMMSLENQNLLQNYYLEAGLWSSIEKTEDIHWGWESPTSQLRGHFLGHWLSAAARIYNATGDREVKAKADLIVDELERCQEENGGEWVGSIPEKYLTWVAKGKPVWAPQYTIHKTFMGLLDMYKMAGSNQALAIATRWADWFVQWTNQFNREQMNDILDYETGGMLEIWADLYEITKRKDHLDLLNTYDRPRLFDALLDGKDPLTNMHANTTVPEILGAARAWEVTGDTRWKQIVEAYWEIAVEKRGYYCTGGQTSGEIWTPPFSMSERLGEKNQEHCTVYNMMRLADILFRWTGDVKYADYWERNLYNGIMSQGYWEGTYSHGNKPKHSHTGLISYFLPMEPGAQKKWGSATEDFWCCHGSLVQANATHNTGIYYYDEEGIIINQYISSSLHWEKDHTLVTIQQLEDRKAGDIARVNQLNTDVMHRPRSLTMDISIDSSIPTDFMIKLRLPWWVDGKAMVMINGDPYTVQDPSSGYIMIQRTWSKDTLQITLPKKLSVSPLPGNPAYVAFMEGPIVLAGLCQEDRMLYGDIYKPDSMLIPDNEREWGSWMIRYRTQGQDRGIRFLPLYDIGFEHYSIYFQVKKQD